MAVWDVAQQPVGDQFAYWHEVICQLFVPLTPHRTQARQGFPAVVETRRLGSINRAMIRSQPQRTDHGPREVRRTDGEFYFVNLQVEGRCAARHGRPDVVVAPGSLTVVDTTRPYWFRFDDPWQMLSFKVPRSLLAPRLPDPAVGTGLAIDGSAGAGAAVTALMSALWTMGDDVPATVEMELEQAFVGLLAAALGALEPAGDASTHAGMRAAVLRFLAANAHDPDLSVTTVSRRFAISPRLLHKLFESHERSFAATLRTMRLERCARLLADPACTATVTDIATRHGFTDAASFSRAFRREYGVAPRDLRHRHPADGAGVSHVVDGS